MKFKGLLFAAAALAASPAFGQTNWIGPAGVGSWHDGTNWDGAVPDGVSAVISDTSFGSTARILDSESDVSIVNLEIKFNQVDIESTRTLSITGNLDIVNGSSITGNGDLNVTGTTTLGATNTGLIVGGGTATFGGMVTLNNGMAAGDIKKSSVTTNGGLSWTGSGDLLFDNVAWTNGAGSTVSRGALAGRLQLNGGSTSNVGKFSFDNSTTAVNLNNGHAFTNSGVFEKDGASSLTVGNSDGATGAFTNSGEVNVLGGSLSFANYVDAGGTINVAAGASVDVGGPLTVTGGKVAGTGTVTDSLTLNGGTIEPGNSPGTLTIDGTLTLDGGATLVLELVDTGDFDILNVTGDVTLTSAGITVDTSGLTANVGDSFTFLTSGGALAGTFTNPASFTSGIYEFDLSYTASSALLTVTAVPEPSSLALLGFAAVGAVVRRRRRS